MLDDSLFDDPDRLTEADSRGLLRSAALAGAQVRAAAETVQEIGFDDLADGRPRSLVLISRPGLGPSACGVLAALAGPSCPVPVIVAESVPVWVGPLDVVFAHTPDPGDPTLAEGVATATRRGASMVLAAPADGPVAASGAGRAKVVPPRIPVPDELTFAHVFTVGLSVLVALGLLRCDTDQLADELDREAERAHPGQEPLMNPAKSLALRLADHEALLWGVDLTATAVAGHGSYALGVHAGLACDVASHAQATTRHALYRSVRDTGSDLFADPDEDGGATPRVFLISTRHDERSEADERTATRSLPGADLVAPGESARADAVLRAAVLALRFDLAAVYLGLAAGTLGGPGRQALAVH
ncbi:hypothetical protein [Saccharopolyspora gregorii]|uniref:Bifunctional glucose-6-phosphate/mannose-6-phosphate isomerase C-terminal domain-containing protein n=1 Tax=Saccharopolyspora gregorii TaxID=33914 RepID=A0ABP6RX92_9PSEU|nr:hypothetical protein [Saccharopolyspora gregorii]